MPFTIHYQFIYLFIMALPIQTAFRGPLHVRKCSVNQEIIVRKNQNNANLFLRNFFIYLLAKYCFSHYIALLFLIITRYHLLYNNWRGYIVSFFALVWIANIYMSLFGLVRVGMKKEGIKQTRRWSGKDVKTRRK